MQVVTTLRQPDRESSSCRFERQSNVSPWWHNIRIWSINNNNNNNKQICIAPVCRLTSEAQTQYNTNRSCYLGPRVGQVDLARQVSPGRRVDPWLAAWLVPTDWRLETMPRLYKTRAANRIPTHRRLPRPPTSSTVSLAVSRDVRETGVTSLVTSLAPRTRREQLSLTSLSWRRPTDGDNWIKNLLSPNSITPTLRQSPRYKSCRRLSSFVSPTLVICVHDFPRGEVKIGVINLGFTNRCHLISVRADRSCTKSSAAFSGQVQIRRV